MNDAAKDALHRDPFLVSFEGKKLKTGRLIEAVRPVVNANYHFKNKHGSRASGAAGLAGARSAASAESSAASRGSAGGSSSSGSAGGSSASSRTRLTAVTRDLRVAELPPEISNHERAARDAVAARDAASLRGEHERALELSTRATAESSLAARKRAELRDLTAKAEKAAKDSKRAARETDDASASTPTIFDHLWADSTLLGIAKSLAAQLEKKESFSRDKTTSPGGRLRVSPLTGVTLTDWALIRERFCAQSRWVSRVEE